MSAAIANELGEELRRSWAEYDPLPEGAPLRRAMAAALPTVTAVSRTSLFAGTLTKGTQADEKRLFPHCGCGAGPRPPCSTRTTCAPPAQATPSARP
ncbi:hypothetical protein [Streptomyces sp. C8S0]|uniref:hypothetical protein n=1 Tax=Streptomyces sp. C8S0 TaxID=2585716 RepID=UPI001D040550|nr:hypothetical protein [Streptomyces sp. C8S0]